MEGCFTSKTVEDGTTLSFKLLKNSDVEALRTATTYTLWSLWSSLSTATDAGAMNTITLEFPPVPEEEDPDEEVPEEKAKWYESKTMQITVSLALSFSSISLLLLLA